MNDEKTYCVIHQENVRGDLGGIKQIYGPYTENEAIEKAETLRIQYSRLNDWFWPEPMKR